VKLTDDVKQRKQKHFKQYRTAKQKLTNKENLVRFLHRGKPTIRLVKLACTRVLGSGSRVFRRELVASFVFYKLHASLQSSSMYNLIMFL